MPSPTTIDELLDLVRKSGVVEDKRLAAYVDKLRAAKLIPAEPAKLAGLLVRDGVLTHFQAEQFMQGKWRRFTIGKYKVLEKLGSGGMGNVFLCEHKLMRRRVAVKVLPAKGTEDTSSLERFYREARAVAALDHPNIVRAYDIDQDDNLHFLVMEHVDGASLQEIVKRNGVMDVLRACHYVRQAALGLQHAYEKAGIIHRDIKPGNILVDRNGIVKILDMGLARFFHDEEDLLTKKFEENVLGTADYLAPEQALDSHSVDIRADIYSLGATFYYCLTGRTPFTEGTVAQKLIWHQTRQPKAVRQLRPEVAEGVVAVLEKMMAKDPNQRYSSPAEVAEALAPWTQTPIPPPPEKEMPQLSPAAMGGSGSDCNVSSGPRTPSTGNPSSSSPRKLWQVKQGGTPSPPPTSPPPPASPPSSDMRKTNPPPPGPLNMQMALPSGLAAVAKPQPLMAAVGVSSPTELPHTRNNGAHQATAVPVLPAPVEAEAWGNILESKPPAKPEYVTASSAPVRRGSVSTTQPVGGLPPASSARPMGWIIGSSSVLLIGLIVLGLILAWIFGGKPDDSVSLSSAPSGVFYVNSRGGSNASTSLSEIIQRVRGKNRQKTRIIVQEDIAESDLLIDVPNVAIEAEEGKIINWRPSSKPGGTRLFAIHKAAGVRIKGFSLDGENRVDFLVNLFHRCPGVRLEGLQLQGFRKFGVWVTNCEGGEDKAARIQLKDLRFITTQPEQAGLYFSIEPGTQELIPKNRFFTFTACTFSGPGAKIKTPNRSTFDHIDWPEGVEPVQGR